MFVLSFINSNAISECLNGSSRVFKAVWALEVSAESLLGAVPVVGTGEQVRAP